MTAKLTIPRYYAFSTWSYCTSKKKLRRVALHIDRDFIAIDEARDRYLTDNRLYVSPMYHGSTALEVSRAADEYEPTLESA